MSITLGNTTDETVDFRWAVTLDGEVVSDYQFEQVPPNTTIFPSQTATVDVFSDATVGIQQRFGFQQFAECIGTLTVEEPTFDPALAGVASRTFSPTFVPDLDEPIAYAGRIQNDNAVDARAELAFYLQVGVPRPVLAQSPRVTVPAGEIWFPRGDVRPLSNPAADQDDVIGCVVAEGGSFEVTSQPVNVAQT